MFYNGYVGPTKNIKINEEEEEEQGPLLGLNIYFEFNVSNSQLLFFSYNWMICTMDKKLTLRMQICKGRMKIDDRQCKMAFKVMVIKKREHFL